MYCLPAASVTVQSFASTTISGSSAHGRRTYFLSRARRSSASVLTARGYHLRSRAFGATPLSEPCAHCRTTAVDATHRAEHAGGCRLSNNQNANARALDANETSIRSIDHVKGTGVRALDPEK